MNQLAHRSRGSWLAALMLSLTALAVGYGLGLLRSAKNQDTPTATSEQVESEARAPTRAETPKHPTAGPQISALEQLRRLVTSPELDVPKILAAVQSLTAVECLEAYNLLQKLTGPEANLFWHAHARRWSQVDPDGAFAAAFHGLPRGIDLRVGKAAAAALVERDLETALQKILDQKGHESRMLAANWILSAVAKVNPARAAEFLVSHKTLARHGALYNEVGREYGRTAPQAALAWAEAIPQKTQREETVRSVWRGWAEADPRAVAAALDQSEDRELVSQTAESVVRAWSRSDPRAALAWLETLSSQETQRGALRGLELDIDALGVETARSLVLSASSEDIRRELAEKISLRLGLKSSAQGLAWAESLPEGTVRNRALEPVLKQWSGIDPAAATAYIAQLPKSEAREKMLRDTVANWSQIEPDAAYQFVQQLADRKERDQAIGEIIAGIREDDPKRALEWFNGLEDPATIGNVAPELVGSLIRTDPAAALKLVERVPAENQPEVYHGLVRDWAFEQPQAATDWINTLPAGKARDSAVAGYVSVVDGSDPAAATAWASTISDPVERTEKIFGAFSRWVEKDETAATIWLKEAAIPEGLRPFFNRFLEEQKSEKKR